MRVRFAPSPTGNVHIGNIRVAIFNYLYAKQAGGQFLLRIEDTDLERSTPEAIENLMASLKWLGLESDEKPVHQTANRSRHEETVAELIRKGYASKAGDGAPTVLHLGADLFDPEFVTSPLDDAQIKIKGGELVSNLRSLIHKTTSSKGDVYTTPINWDALDVPTFILEDESEVDGMSILSKITAECAGDSLKEIDVNALCPCPVAKIVFKRRYVYFEDEVLGRLQKPLDSMRDLVIVRSDGSPVFHLANVVDDVDMKITDILRGNDHVENTYRHLFIYKAIGATPPKFAHFPMIVNAKGKPYSKRDGDAYVGDFKNKGYLPQCLLNFLALCGWSPGDDREIMTIDEMVSAFKLSSCSQSAAQFNLEKLEWMNGQYLINMPADELMSIIKQTLEGEGLSCPNSDPAWLERLVEINRERMKTTTDFIGRTRFFFTETVELDAKAVKKNLLKRECEGLKTLVLLKELLDSVDDWTEDNLEAAIAKFTEDNELKMGQVAQPLRVACTGNTVSPGIGETLFLLSKETTCARIASAIEQLSENLSSVGEQE